MALAHFCQEREALTNRVSPRATNTIDRYDRRQLFDDGGTKLTLLAFRTTTNRYTQTQFAYQGRRLRSREHCATSAVATRMRHRKHGGQDGKIRVTDWATKASTIKLDMLPIDFGRL